MGKVHQIGKIKIIVYANDHLPPHFHIVAPDFEAFVEIATGTVLAGSIGRQGRAAAEWANANRAVIVAEWNRINPRFPIR